MLTIKCNADSIESVERLASRAIARISSQRSLKRAAGVLSVIQPSPMRPTRRSARSAMRGGVSSGLGLVAIQIGGDGVLVGFGAGGGGPGPLKPPPWVPPAPPPSLLGGASPP